MGSVEAELEVLRYCIGFYSLTYIYLKYFRRIVASPPSSVRCSYIIVVHINTSIESINRLRLRPME